MILTVEIVAKDFFVRVLRMCRIGANC